MGSLQNSFIWTGASLALVVLNACSLSSSKDDPALHVDLSSYQDHSGRFALLNGGGLIHGLAPPQAATGFSCYGVNVTGPGIMDSSMHPNGENPMLTFNKTLAGDYCTYRGVITPPITLDGTGSADVALQLPPGGIRLVQVFGVNDPALCTAANFGNDGASGGNSGGSKYFELGRGVVQDLFSDRSIEVTTTWPTAAGIQGDIDRGKRALDCGGNCIHPIDGPANGLAKYATTDLNIDPGTGTTSLAQRFTVPSTTYLRRAEVAVDGAVGTVLTADIYETSSNVSLLSATEIAVGPIATADGTLSSSVGLVDFDFFSSAYIYRALNPLKNYFFVITFKAGHGVGFHGASGALGVPGSVSTYTSGDTTFAVNTGNREIFMKINACN